MQREDGYSKLAVHKVWRLNNQKKTMKRFLFLILIIAGTAGLQADNWITITENNANESNIQLVNSNISQTTLNFNLSGFWYNEVETDLGTAWNINIEGSAKRLEQGRPALPLFATSVVIPAHAKMKVEAVSSNYVEYQNILIAPSKGNFDRTIDPSTVPYEFGPQYDRNEFFPTITTDLRQPYIIRDFRGQTVLINPFVYNPVTKVLRVYYEITLDISEDGISNINTLSSDAIPENIDKSFSNIYQQHFINYQSSDDRYDPVGEHGNMLIISYGDFMDEMIPFIDWRTKTGTSVEIIDVAEIGNTSQIKTYIADYYNDNGLTFVLLVGDSPQVPSSVTGGNDSDVDYSYIVGNDHYPDLFVGRFSAENTTHVATMVSRTIAYERTPEELPWYADAIGVASNQGPGDDNEYDYEHIRNIHENKLFPFTYNYGYEFFDGSQGGEDATGNPNPSQIATAINAGASIINYVGHGSNTSWGTSGFSNSNVNNLTNTGKLPFIISVACVNGNFVGHTCFAEAWLRAEDNGEPTGAIAAFMSTINQSWDPPMRGQDEMNDILTEADEDNIKRTFGGITMNGCMGMNDSYGAAGYEMTDTWTIFGDPSLMVRTAEPQILTVDHLSTLFIGASSLVVNCDAEGAIVALTMSGNIIGTAVVESGSATINFEALNDVGVMDIVVTAFNYIPYESTIEIVPADGAYIVYSENTINDAAGNNDGLIDYNESVMLSIALSNIGTEDADGVNATISTDNEFVTITDGTETYGTITAESTVSIEDAYAFDVTSDIPDGSLIKITILVADAAGRQLWETSFNLFAHAPLLNFESFIIDDNAGNQNGKIDPGENVDIIVNISNIGSSEAFNTLAVLSTTSSYLTINGSEFDLGNLEGGNNADAVFNVTASDETPDGTVAEFDLDINADFEINTAASFATFIGQKPVIIINYSTQSSSADEMMSCFNVLTVGAEQTQGAFPEDLSIYKSVFIILGVYPNNHALTTEEGDQLSEFLENGGKAYMEGGDAWAYDTQTAGHQKFMIEGVADGTGDLNTILGYEGTWLQGYSFNYGGENSYIDHLVPLEGANIILENDSPIYGVSISYETEVYKTIGSSANFGGLVDEAGSTKDGLMAEYLYFFNVNFIWTDIDNNRLDEAKVSAYPNPFDNVVNISVDLPDTQIIDISIYDMTGKRVTTLVNSEVQEGRHIYNWDAKSSPAGIYFYSVKTANQNYTKKLILTK